jgi:hypothetical protein
MDYAFGFLEITAAYSGSLLLALVVLGPLFILFYRLTGVHKGRFKIH